LEEIRRLKRPQYAYIAGVAEYNLADLDRVMTVEKAVIATWAKIQGCKSDADTRSLGEALARKRSRFAFPDDFNRFAQKLQQRMQKRHDKADDDGVALRALREIRVQAAPAWDAERVELNLAAYLSNPLRYNAINQPLATNRSPPTYGHQSF
jgi:hypothetical protein